jgi:hypothetical protein
MAMTVPVSLPAECGRAGVGITDFGVRAVPERGGWAMPGGCHEDSNTCSVSWEVPLT